MCPYPVLRRLSVQLTDCSSWLGPRNHIRLEGKSFQLPDGLQSHQSIPWDKPAYRCTMCYKQFTREDDLQDHKLAHLSIEPFQEGKSFQLPDGLQSHQSIPWDKPN
ncbi:hypothetical protein CRUP_025945 [Coryphaenoides rupestris]|nr:hypothetical protein CRUP_025945 [Coryphaenoides rupestris]